MINTKALLKQERKRIKSVVDESPTIAIIHRISLISDGYGGEVEDPSGAASEFTVRLRLSHDAKNPAQKTTINDNTFSTNLNRLATWEYNVVIKEGDVFSAIDKRFTVGPVDTLIKFGGIVGFQAPLNEAENVNGV